MDSIKIATEALREAQIALLESDVLSEDAQEADVQYDTLVEQIGEMDSVFNGIIYAVDGM